MFQEWNKYIFYLKLFFSQGKIKSFVVRKIIEFTHLKILALLYNRYTISRKIQSKHITDLQQSTENYAENLNGYD